MAPGWVKRMLSTNKSDKKKHLQSPSASKPRNSTSQAPSTKDELSAQDARSRSVPPVVHRELTPDAFAPVSPEDPPKSVPRGNGFVSPGKEGRAYRWASAPDTAADRSKSQGRGTRFESPPRLAPERHQHVERGCSATPRRSKRKGNRLRSPGPPDARDSSPPARVEMERAASEREAFRREQEQAQWERDRQVQEPLSSARSGSSAQTVPQQFQRGGVVMPAMEIPDQEFHQGPPPAGVNSGRPPRSPERSSEPATPARRQPDESRAKQSKHRGTMWEDGRSQTKSDRTSPSAGLGEDLVGICDNRQDFLDSPVRPNAKVSDKPSLEYETDLLPRQPPANSVNLRSGELRIMQSGEVHWINGQAGNGEARAKTRPDASPVPGNGRTSAQLHGETPQGSGRLPPKNPRLYDSDIFNSLNSTRAGLYAYLAPLSSHATPAPLSSQVMRTADFPSTPDIVTPANRERDPRRQTPPGSWNSAYASDAATGRSLQEEPSRARAYISDNEGLMRYKAPAPGGRYLELRDSLDLAGLSMPPSGHVHRSKAGLYSDSYPRPPGPGFYPDIPRSDPFQYRQEPRVQARIYTESYAPVRYLDTFQEDEPRARNPLFDSQAPVRQETESTSSSEHHRRGQPTGGAADVRARWALEAAQGSGSHRSNLEAGGRGPRLDNLATLYGEMVETRGSEAFNRVHGTVQDRRNRQDYAALHADSRMPPDDAQDPIARRLQLENPARQAQELEGVEREMDSLRTRLRAATEPLRDAGQRDVQAPFPAMDDSDEEVAELRRVVAYLRSELSGLEHELHDVRQQLAAKEARGDSADDIDSLAAQLAASERDKEQLASLVDELRGNLERTVAEKDAELKELRAALEAAQNDAAAQEDAAELARGELDEFRRRLQAEVEHARHEALLAARDETGRASQLQEEVERLAAAAQRARQERDSLCDLLAAGSRKHTDMDQNILDLEDEVDAQRDTIAKLKDTLAQMEADKAGLEVSQMRVSERQAGSQKEAEELREALVQLRSENVQLAAEREKLKADKAVLQGAQKAASRRRSSPPQLDSGVMFSGSSNVDTMDLGGADFDGFELGSFDLGEPEGRRESRQAAKNAQLADKVASALDAAQKANEEKAELMAENSELRMKLRESAGPGARDEMSQLREVQGLADEALKALEAQTQEVTQLRAEADAARRALEQRETQLSGARMQLSQQEKPFSDRGSEAPKVRDDSAYASRDFYNTTLSDVHSGMYSRRVGESARARSQSIPPALDTTWNQARAPTRLPSQRAQVYNNQQVFEADSQKDSLDKMRSELLNTQHELEDLRNAFAASAMNIMDTQASLRSGFREPNGASQRGLPPMRDLHGSNGAINGARSGSGQLSDPRYSQSSLDTGRPASGLTDIRSPSRIPGPSASYEPRSARGTPQKHGAQH